MLSSGLDISRARTKGVHSGWSWKELRPTRPRPWWLYSMIESVEIGLLHEVHLSDAPVQTAIRGSQKENGCERQLIKEFRKGGCNDTAIVGTEHSMKVKFLLCSMIVGTWKKKAGLKFFSNGIWEKQEEEDVQERSRQWLLKATGSWNACISDLDTKH